MRRVTTSGSNITGGSSWGQAMNLQTALGSSACTKLRVATGTYTPTVAASPTYSDRDNSFNVRLGAKVYGGFADTESQRSQRDVAANPAALSGDISIQGNHDHKSFRVVNMDGTTGAGSITASTMLDGFTIRDGFANSNMNFGGGPYCNDSGSSTLTTVARVWSRNRNTQTLSLKGLPGFSGAARI